MKKEYPWDRPNFKQTEKVRPPIEKDQRTFKAMVRAERKRLKKLKHAGVREEDWGGSHEV